MGLYRDWVLPRIVNVACGTPVTAEERKKALAGVQGNVLELGFGTGHNLPFYPGGVERVTAVDPSTASARLARSRIAAAPFRVEYMAITGERIEAPDESFDSVVSTYTLCSVADPVAVLEQIRRVLKPAGRFHLLEHGLADEPGVQRWQQRLNGLNGLLLGGCTLNRDIERLVRQAGFAFDVLEKYYVEGDPKFIGWVTRAVARTAPSRAELHSSGERFGKE
jgi:ubiquinone/menaquinone biosynthesis C-methylase UbiE